MGRIVKKAQEKRKEIFLIAQDLFFKYGNANTSVQIIIDELGISKGAFYHYFNSKIELLDCISDLLTSDIISKIKPIVNNTDLNAIEKLNKLYTVTSNYKTQNLDIIYTITKALFKKENLFLRHNLNNKLIEKTIPLMTRIFQQGIDEAVFKIDTPMVMTRIILLFGISRAEHNAKLLLQNKDDPDSLEDLSEYLALYQLSVERMLGAPEDSIQAFDKNFINNVKQKLNDLHV
ncbi:MAG: TetR/AcrR family transcriptional regulator [Candidatus Cloacimonetes bacterium]|nr:TetR/AcrR family transcriptional regulator [Candidatus Cloacimonadota bacterium]